MAGASTWSTIWPVVTFVGGIAANQALEWTKGREIRKLSHAARRHAIEDQRHQYELKVLADAHATAADLFKEVVLFQAAAADGRGYDRNRVDLSQEIACADLISKLQTLTAVVFDDPLRSELEALTRRAISAMGAPNNREANSRMNAYRDVYHRTTELIGERIRRTYQELAASIDS